MLESAVCFLPMMAMFFGIIDVCYAVSIQSLLSQATRAGSRWAVTYQTAYDGNTCTSQATCIAQVVQDNSVGFLAGNKSNYVTVNYYITGPLPSGASGLTSPVLTCNAGSCTVPSGAPPLAGTAYSYTAVTNSGTSTVTVSYANQPGNVVEVSIPAFPLFWMVPIVGTAGYNYSAGSQVTDLNGNKGLGLSLSASAVDVLGGLAQGTSIPPTP
jgi:TadE-like protein